MRRHGAPADRFGDPAGFRTDGCTAQRNLREEGRQQAAAIGAWLRARGIGSARVYSSQWGRCLETAELLGLGAVSPPPSLNFLSQQPEDREPNLTALRHFLAKQPLQSEPLVLVTYQATVTAMTGTFPNSGEGVVARLGEDREFSDFARLDFGHRASGVSSARLPSCPPYGVALRQSASSESLVEPGSSTAVVSPLKMENGWDASPRRSPRRAPPGRGCSIRGNGPTMALPGETRAGESVADHATRRGLTGTAIRAFPRPIPPVASQHCSPATPGRAGRP